MANLCPFENKTGQRKLCRSLPEPESTNYKSLGYGKPTRSPGKIVSRKVTIHKQQATKTQLPKRLRYDMIENTQPMRERERERPLSGNVK